MIVYLDNIRQKIAYEIAKVLAKTKITPNQITVLRFVLAAPLSMYFFSRGEYLYNLAGLFFYVSLATLDWVDGNLARMTGRTSFLGKWLDDTLDRILMLIVLCSVFYAGIVSDNSLSWAMLGISFFSICLFLTALLSDFDQKFNLEFSIYSEIVKKTYEINANPKLIDRLLLNFLDVHRNSISRFCFCLSYPLLLGIIVNQLWFSFVFMTFMLGLRSAGILFITYRVVKNGQTNSALTRVLREYLNETKK